MVANTADRQKQNRTTGNRKRSRLQAPQLASIDPNGQEAVEVQVYERLRRSLISGALAPGTLLSSRSLAESLKVSSMPVRDALKKLEADGVLESRAKRGVEVRYITGAEFREILKVRLSVEGLVVREAAERITAAGVDSVRALERKIFEAEDHRTALDANYKMHFGIYRWAGMPIALSFIENIWLRLGPAFHLIEGGYTMQNAHDAHAAIIAGLEKNDPDAAEQALHSDLMGGAKVMEQRLDQAQQTQAAARGKKLSSSSSAPKRFDAIKPAMGQTDSSS